MAVDPSQALKDAENVLRDFIQSILGEALGPDWIEKCGMAKERAAKSSERKAVEARRQEAGVVEERLIYYADFYDRGTILHKNWGPIFSAALGDWKTFEVYLAELGRLRDPDAHRRELLPHQKSLIDGIGGEIRNRIVRYRAKITSLPVNSIGEFQRLASAKQLTAPAPAILQSWLGQEAIEALQL